MPSEKKTIVRWNASATGLVTALALAAVLGTAYLRDAAPVPAPAAIVISVVLIGAFAALCHLREWWTLLVGAAAGLLVGALSSIGLMWQPVAGLYPVVAATMALFLMIGTLVGAFFEFIFFLHRLVHRGQG